MSYLIKVSPAITTKFVVIKNQKFLLLIKNQNSVFISIPFNISINKLDKNLILTTLKADKSVLSFISKINSVVKTFSFGIKKKLKMQGLGLKCAVSSDETLVTLKLGYSHEVPVSNDPKVIKVSTNKNMISLESFNPVKLGDFCSKIIALKKPNVYKGKGIWFKDANPELKAIKKT